MRFWKWELPDVREQARHDYEEAFPTSRGDLVAMLDRPLSQASVLILGCGYNYPDVVLYTPIAGRVVGLDVQGAFYRDGIGATLRAQVASGRNPLQGAVHAAALVWKYHRYFLSLEEIAGVRIEHERYALASYDGRHMPFDDGAFDIVMSNAVLEHVEDLDSLFREARRVTRPDGIAYHLWHNFYSFSGGHVPEARAARHPWGHLRGAGGTHVFLNRATPSDIAGCFARHFSVTAQYAVDVAHRKQGVDPGFTYERQDLLSADLQAEFRDYPPDILLTRAYLVVGRKRDHVAADR